MSSSVLSALNSTTPTPSPASKVAVVSAIASTLNPTQQTSSTITVSSNATALYGAILLNSSATVAVSSASVTAAPLNDTNKALRTTTVIRTLFNSVTVTDVIVVNGTVTIFTTGSPAKTASSTIVPIAVTTSLANITSASGKDDSCDQYYIAQAGDSCAKVATLFTMPLATFMSYNPSIESCDRLKTGDAYCVIAHGNQGSASLATPESVSNDTTASANGTSSSAKPQYALLNGSTVIVAQITSTIPASSSTGSVSGKTTTQSTVSVSSSSSTSHASAMGTSTLIASTTASAVQVLSPTTQTITRVATTTKYFTVDVTETDYITSTVFVTTITDVTTKYVTAMLTALRAVGQPGTLSSNSACGTPKTIVITRPASMSPAIVATPGKSSSRTVSTSIRGTSSVRGTTSTTSAAGTVATTTRFCPTLNGTVWTDPQGSQHLIYCDIAFRGTTVDSTAVKKRATSPTSLAQCISVCDGMQSCVGTAFDGKTCTYYNSLGSSYASSGMQFARVVSKAATSSGSIRSSTTTKTISASVYATTVTKTFSTNGKLTTVTTVTSLTRVTSTLPAVKTSSAVSTKATVMSTTSRKTSSATVSSKSAVVSRPSSSVKPSSASSSIKATSVKPSSAPSSVKAISVKSSSSSRATASSSKPAVSSKVSSSVKASSAATTLRTSLSSTSKKTTCATAPPPAPTQTGIVSGCTKWYVAQSGDYCYLIADEYGLDVNTFMAWNPAVNAPSCNNVQVNAAYCVAVGCPASGASSTLTSSAGSPTTKTTSASTVTSATSTSSVVPYKMYTGNGTVAAGWPSQAQWKSFDALWTLNLPNMRQSCENNWAVPNDSDSELGALKAAILDIGTAQGVDPRFILAIIMQESNGCVRVITTSYGVRNPGLMQSHNGAGTCNEGGTVQTPCPASEIQQMVEDGVAGTSSGDGLVQCLAETGVTDISKFYRAARIYNGGVGGYRPDDLGSGCCTLCYSSDVANRLTGWATGNSKCSL
ncbi:hypothetical protein AAFC00_002192 [Neodothiora populina]